MIEPLSLRSSFSSQSKHLELICKSFCEAMGKVLWGRPVGAVARAAVRAVLKGHGVPVRISDGPKGLEMITGSVAGHAVLESLEF